MVILCDNDAGLVTKRAETAAQREALGREARILRVVAHPGVVQLVGVDGEPPDQLVLRHVAGGDLSARRGQTVEVVAGVGATLATVVADLHDIGVSHGAIEASHVLLDQDGRPVLCSFGRARKGLPPDSSATRRDDDIRALAGLILDCCPDRAPARTIRALRLVAGPRRRRQGRDARWLARQLIATVPHACLTVADGENAVTGATTSEPPDRTATPGGLRRSTRGLRPIRGWRRRPVVVGLCAIGSGAALAGAWVWAHEQRSPGPVRHVATPCPMADRGCGPLALVDGLVVTGAGRYALSTPGDVVVIGRWGCGAALPAVLRPTTGEVWTFAAWPAPGRPEVGQLAARVAAAASLQVRPEPSGCDRVIVERRGLPSVTIDPVQP